MNLGPVVLRLSSANPMLNFNLGFLHSFIQKPFWDNSCVLSRALSSPILDEKNLTEFSLKVIRSEIRFHINHWLS